MILHLDDRLLHGKILHGWAAAEAPRIVLISTRLQDFGLSDRCQEAAGGSLCICLATSAKLPEPEPGDFWLTDNLDLARELLGARKAESLKIIGMRQQGEELGPDFCPNSSSRKLLDEIASQGLRIEIQSFPSSRARIWPL
jgi:hypothetical protein